MRSKTTRAFRTISEAGEELGLQPHVLRFWESKFPDITPIKRGGGRRFYRPEDIEFIRGIKKLLHDEGHPIKDVQKLIAKSGAARIVELGRSVEQASRDRDVSEMTLVPERIEKPDIAYPEPSEALSDASLPEMTQTEASTGATGDVKADPSQTDMRDQTDVSKTDLTGLQNALERLESLKSQWDKFDADANKGAR